LHRVVNVGEVARLFAVAENSRLSILQKRRAKLRQHSGIRRTGILPRPENVEVAERGVLQAVAAAKRLKVKLANVFRNSVRGNGLRLHGLDLWQRRRLAISRRRCGEHHALDLQFLCRDQNVERAINIYFVRLDGVLDRARHGCARGQVQHIFRFVHRFSHHLDVGDAALDEGNFVADFRQVVFLAGRKVV